MEHGEVVALGKHRLLCGDAFNDEHVDALLQGEKPAMLYCDPPYGIALDTDYKDGEGYGTGRVWGERRRVIHEVIQGDERPFEPSAIRERFASCREQFWWGANNYAHAIIPDLTEGSWIVWDKRVTEPFDKMFGSAFELCWSQKRHRYQIARVRYCGVFGMHPKGVENRRYTPTQKPVALAEWFISRYSKEGDIILDLFGGSGSTLLACERLNRRCLMAEISPDYCGVIRERYERLTQQPSLLDAI